jgi:hypothetical protein
VAEVKKTRTESYLNQNRNVRVHCYIAGEPGQLEPALPHCQDWWNIVSRHNLVFEGRKQGTASLFSLNEKKRVCSTGTATVTPSTGTVMPPNGVMTEPTTLTFLQKTAVNFKLSAVFMGKKKNVTHADITSSSRLLAETQEKKEY